MSNTDGAAAAFRRGMTPLGDRRFLTWWGASVLIVYILQGVPALLRYPPWTAGDSEMGMFERIPLWTGLPWVSGIVAFAVVLGLLERMLRGRNYTATFWAAGLATVAYMLVPAVLVSDWIRSTPRQFIENAQGVVALDIGVWGNTWVALLVPLLLAALPKQRRYFYPPVPPSPADEDDDL